MFGVRLSFRNKRLRTYLIILGPFLYCAVRIAPDIDSHVHCSTFSSHSFVIPVIMSAQTQRDACHTASPNYRTFSVAY